MISCRTGKQSTMVREPNSVAERDEILFLNLMFSYDSLTNSTVAELIDFKIVEGKLKADFVGKMNKEPTNLRIAFYDVSANLLKSIIIDNPLFQNAEHFAESGEISRTLVKLPKIEFSLRAQIPHACSFITVSEVGEPVEMNGNLLLKFNLGDENENSR